MESRRDKVMFQNGIQLYFVLIFLVSLISCSGQENNSLRELKTIESPNNGFQNPDSTWVDPLFFIDGQLCSWVRDIFQDKSGNLWFGTNHYGVMRYDGDTLQYFSEIEGLGGGRINEILEDKKGNVWLATHGGITKYGPRLAKAQAKTFTNYPVTDQKYNNEVWSAVIDNEGIFWLGTSEGVFKFDGENFTPFPIPKIAVKDTTSILSYDRITSVLLDRYGVFWFGTDGFGICKYDPSAEEKGRPVFTHITKEDGLCDDNISEIMEDSNGNIWVGTMYGGVSLINVNSGGKNSESFINFNEEGLITGVEVSGFYEDKNGNIWFAVENHGVYCYKQSIEGAEFTNYYKEEGLITNGILSILQDKEGRFWFGGWGGLFRYDGTSFVSVTRKGPWLN